MKRGLRPQRWVVNFVLSYIILNVGIVILLWFLLGKEVFTNPDKIHKLLPFLPVSIAAEVLLYILFRYLLKRQYIASSDVVNGFNDENDEPPQKDLSYFR
ncbi:MAG: hypothetical protein RMJ53_01155 [Chitinophagales bacterium]|nr:hypothetical protein [Chitinophagales bacterium]MDW8272818.1 hypothetical protein [Chitinophagales bacterium]